MHVLADGPVQLLPLQAVHFHGQDIGQRRVEISARAVGVEAAQHDQALAVTDRVLELLQFRLLEGRGIDVAKDIDVIFARLEQFLQIAGLRLFEVPRIEADEIDLDVARGIQRTTQKFLFHAEIAFDIQHVQSAFEHLHERAELVVRGHQFAGLGNGLQGQLEFARRFRHVGEVDRQQLAVGRGRDIVLLAMTFILPSGVSMSTRTGIFWLT